MKKKNSFNLDNKEPSGNPDSKNELEGVISEQKKKT